MMRNAGIILVLAALGLLLLVISASAMPAPSPLYQASPSVPGMMSYQGCIAVHGAKFNGTGLFKFTIVNGAGSAAYWSNDGTGLLTATFTPTQHITLTVNNCIFGVLLGDTTVAGMTQPITASVFSAPDRFLRVWFDDQVNGWQQFAPDVALASAPYAMHVQGLNIAGNTLTVTASGVGALASGVAGGQTIYGGTAASDTLRLNSTSNITSGYVILQSEGGNVGLGITPTEQFEINFGNIRINLESAPTSAAWPVVASGTGVGAGWHYYVVTFVTSRGETDSSSSNGLNITDTANLGRVHLSSIPVGSGYVISRKLYRSNPANTGFHYLTVINDNSTTTYDDTASDATVEANDRLTAKNSTGGTFYFNANPTIVLAAQNTSVGYGAGGNQTGLFGVNLGYQAGYAQTYGQQNTNIGYKAGQAITAGVENTMVGYQAGLYATSGGYNTFVGGDSGRNTTTGSKNLSVGYLAGLYNGTGSNNIFLGGQSGMGASNYTGASNNVVIGYQSGYKLANNSSSNIFLGYQAGYNETGSNKLYIANSNTTSPLIWGDFASPPTVRINGNLEPAVSNTLNLGSSALWWNEVHYHTLTSHSLGSFENGVKLQDGRVVTCIDALALLRSDPAKKTLPNGQPYLDYSTLPAAAYRPAVNGTVVRTFTTTVPTTSAIPMTDTETGLVTWTYTKTETLLGEVGADLDAMVSLVLCAANEVNAKEQALEARLAAIEAKLGIKP